MPLIAENFSQDRATTNVNTPSGCVARAKYKTSDTIAEVTASGYFNGVYNITPSYVEPTLKIGDLILVKCSDYAGLIEITALEPNVTTTLVPGHIADGSITTAKLADGAVTNPKLGSESVSLEKLQPGIAMTQVAKFANNNYTTTGGSVTENISVPGVTDQDYAFVVVNQVGATPRQIMASFADTDIITVTFNGDPSTDHVLTYIVYRDAA